VIEPGRVRSLTIKGADLRPKRPGALLAWARENAAIRTIVAYTLPERNTSTRVLEKCGFRHVGEVVHLTDGPVWRWEKQAERGPCGGASLGVEQPML
jgi:hypothetical protein